jgi:ketosteroid isomerase-like protein
MRDGVGEPRVTSTDDVVMTDVLVGEGDRETLEIARFESRLRSAQLSGDSAALGLLIAEDLLFTGPDGELATREQDLQAHASGLVRFRAHDPIELRIRMLAPAIAIAALKTHLSVEVGGTLHTGTFRYTRVWQRADNDSWQVVAGHVSAVTGDR